MVDAAVKRRRVMLVEAGTSGHRPVILRYLRNHLPHFGWIPEVCTESHLAALSPRDLHEIEGRACAAGCDLVHLLTVDGCARNWVRRGRLDRHCHVPVIGTYYLYDNLAGLRSIGWWLAFQRGHIDHLLISDESIDHRRRMFGIRKRLSYAPDPWSKADFIACSMAEARNRLQLPQAAFIILVFGEISMRKGVDRILAALRQVKAPGLRILFAGRAAPDCQVALRSAGNDPLLSGQIIVHDKYIDESDVANYFYSANAVLSDYGKQFSVSSGVFTRALASGRLPILPAHGVNARVIERLRFGILYESENVRALASAMRAASETRVSVPDSVRLEAERREVNNYARVVAEAYDRLLSINSEL